MCNFIAGAEARLVCQLIRFAAAGLLEQQIINAENQEDESKKDGENNTNGCTRTETTTGDITPTYPGF
jgi:hypothetical protein